MPGAWGWEDTVKYCEMTERVVALTAPEGAGTGEAGM